MFDLLVDISMVISKNNEKYICIVDIFIETGAARYITDLSKQLDLKFINFDCRKS